MEVPRKGPYSQIDAKRSFANDAFVVSFYRQVSHMGPNGHIDAKTSFAIVFSKHLHSQNDAQHPRKWCSETIIFSAAPVNVCQRQWQWHVSCLRHSTAIAPLTYLVNSSPVRYSAALFREAGDPASEANLSGYYVVLNYLVNKWHHDVTFSTLLASLFFIMILFREKCCNLGLIFNFVISKKNSLF